METSKVIALTTARSIDRADSYQYTECGLPNIFIHGKPLCDDKGNSVYVIENVTGLHKVIAYCIVMKRTGMSGAELRFLRTEMGYTQSELARLLHKEVLTIGRWEKGDILDSNAEAIIRMIAFEKLKLEGSLPEIEDMVKRCVHSATSEPITIDGSNPKHYKPLVAA